MHPYKRSKRVGDLIREEVADIIMHRMKDPRLGFVTVTDTRVSDDLRHAKIYVTVFESSKKEEMLKVLQSSARFIRGELCGRLKMKFVPELFFKLDEAVEYGGKIDKLLDEIKTSKNLSDDNEDSD